MAEAVKMERGRGRPRDIGKDNAIRDAFWSILAERGYGGLTFEAIAEEAGCSRATLYRRFSSRLELTAAILDQTSRAIEPTLPDAVDPRETFRAHAAAAVAYMSGGRGAAILSLSAAAARTPELRCAVNAYKINEREFYYEAFRKLAPNAGEARMAFAFDSFIGMMIHNVIIAGRKLDGNDLERIIDTTLYMLHH